MATQSWPAQGTTIGVDETGSGTYTLINEVKSIANAGGGEVGERDTTVLTSTVKTSAPTIPDNGEVTFELNADPTDTVHVFIQGMKDTPSTRTFQVTFNTTPAKSVAFPAFVKTIDGVNAEDVDSSLGKSVTLRVAGAVTWS